MPESTKDLVSRRLSMLSSLTTKQIYRQKVDDDTTDDNRKAAGVTQQPFDQKPAQMQALGVTRPNVRHRSAEEYPFASTAQGGYGANLFPVKQAQQNSSYLM